MFCSMRAQDPPQQLISGDERDFVTMAELLRQPFSAVLVWQNHFGGGNVCAMTVLLECRCCNVYPMHSGACTAFAIIYFLG